MTNKKIREINKELKKLVKEFNNTNILHKAEIKYKHIHKYENDLCITFFNRNTHNNSCIDFYVFFKDKELENKLEVVKLLLKDDSLLSDFINDKYTTLDKLERSLRD